MKKIKRVTANSDIFRLAIDNEYGEELAILSFNVTDPNLISRIQNGYKALEKIVKDGETELNGLGYDEKTSDIMANSQYYSKITEIDKKLKDELNYMFDNDIASAFGNANLLTPTAEGYLIFNIMDAVIPALKEEMSIRAKAREKSYQDFKARH